MKNFNELSGLELDTLREIGSIGTGNAATALSSLLQCEVRIEMPEVRILGYNEAIDWIGGPEGITAGVPVCWCVWAGKSTVLCSRYSRWTLSIRCWAA